mgnify:CR=1 FL=1
MRNIHIPTDVFHPSRLSRPGGLVTAAKAYTDVLDQVGHLGDWNGEGLPAVLLVTHPQLVAAISGKRKDKQATAAREVLLQWLARNPCRIYAESFALDNFNDWMAIADHCVFGGEPPAEHRERVASFVRLFSIRIRVPMPGFEDDDSDSADPPSFAPPSTAASDGNAAWARALRLAGLRELADTRRELLPTDGDPLEIEAVARALEWTCYQDGNGWRWAAPEGTDD